jgi:predicted dehydrogenase
LPDTVSASLKVFEKGRQLDDYGHAVIRFQNGALGTVTASQITHGRENDIFIEVDGTKGALQWRQEDPNRMIVRQNGKPHQIYFRDGNAPFSTPLHKSACRIPAGHPEGYLEAFGNVYRGAYDAIVQRAAGQKFETKNTVYPNVYDGVEGMYFIQQCVASSKENGAWLPLKHAAARR